jgi:sugar lactone lactonase YvrE
VLLAVLAPASTTPARTVVPATDLVWPAPPSPPRVRWLASVSSDRDAGASRSWFDRIRTAITGGSGLRMGRPIAVWAGPGGSYLVCDPSTHAVYEGRPDKGTLRLFSASDRLASPVGVTRLPSGEVWVSDADRGVIVRLDARGRWRGEFGGGVLVRPTGLAWDAARSRLYVADTHGHCIRVFDARGSHLADLGRRGNGPGEFDFPTDVKVTPEGDLVVCDALNGRIQRLGQDGRPLAMFGRLGDARGDFGRPKGVALDAEGHVYVMDTLYDVLQVFDAEGRLLLVVGGTGADAGRFNLPAGIAVDATDRIYVCDSANGRVQVFQCVGGATGR